MWDGNFSKDEEYWLHRGTRPAAGWIDDLRRYQVVYGRGSIPPRVHEPFGALAQWVQRMRRYAASGNLSMRVATAMLSMGVGLELDASKREAAEAYEEEAFLRNIDLLLAWMRSAPPADHGLPNLTYKESCQTDAAKKCYAFLRNSKLKRRQGILPVHHLGELRGLRMLVNGKSIRQHLATTESMRSVDRTIDTEGDDATLLLPRERMSEGRAIRVLRNMLKGKTMIYTPGVGLEPVLNAEVFSWDDLEIITDKRGKPKKACFNAAYTPSADEDGLVRLVGWEEHPIDQALMFPTQSSQESRDQAHNGRSCRAPAASAQPTA